MENGTEHEEKERLMLLKKKKKIVITKWGERKGETELCMMGKKC